MIIITIVQEDSQKHIEETKGREEWERKVKHAEEKKEERTIFIYSLLQSL